MDSFKQAKKLLTRAVGHLGLFSLNLISCWVSNPAIWSSPVYTVSLLGIASVQQPFSPASGVLGAKT